MKKKSVRFGSCPSTARRYSVLPRVEEEEGGMTDDTDETDVMIDRLCPKFSGVMQIHNYPRAVIDFAPGSGTCLFDLPLHEAVHVPLCTAIYVRYEETATVAYHGNFYQFTATEKIKDLQRDYIQLTIPTTNRETLLRIGLNHNKGRIYITGIFRVAIDAPKRTRSKENQLLRDWLAPSHTLIDTTDGAVGGYYSGSDVADTADEEDSESSSSSSSEMAV